MWTGASINAFVAGCGRVGFTPAAYDDAAIDGDTEMIIEIGVNGAGTTDTFLHSSSPTLNYGVDQQLNVGSSDRAVIRFDVSAIPANITPVAASLRILPIASGDISGERVDVVRLLEPWDELAATWNLRLPAVPWSDPGAGASSREASPMGSLSIATLVPDVPTNIELDPIRVREWVIDPATNFGVVLEGVPAHVHFDSSETIDPARAPRLILTVR